MSNDVNPQDEPTPRPREPETTPGTNGPSTPQDDAPRQGPRIPSGFLRSHAPDPTPELPPKKRRPRTEDVKARSFTAAERLHLLDVWQRSGLAASEFAALVGVNKHSLYGWKKKFETDGPAGLEDRPRGGGARQKLTDLTRRAILMIKKAHPEYGCERISYLLQRGPALAASPATVTKVLHEAGYVLSDEPTHKHREFVRRFERASPNQLWQTDLFTFVLKRQNVRVYLVAFMDDHSRFVVGYGLHMSQSTALTLEVLRAGIASYGRPEEILTDNGTQYVTWRGKSAFTKECEKRGIKQIVASPRHPQTLGKIERFWGTLWREFLEAAVFQDLADARKRIGLFIDHYNFQRPHQSCEGLVPADRFFGAASEVKKTLAARVAANALDLAQNGVPRKPFYLTGQVDGKPFSIHAAGERLILTKEGGSEEIELAGRDAGQRVLDVVAKRETLRLVELRAELKDLSRADVDGALRALEYAGAIAMGTSDPAAFTADDRAAALDDPIRGPLVFVTLGKLPIREVVPEAVCPDGSPTGELPPDDDFEDVEPDDDAEDEAVSS
jgi:transposase InsO family protein